MIDTTLTVVCILAACSIIVYERRGATGAALRAAKERLKGALSDGQIFERFKELLLSLKKKL